MTVEKLIKVTFQMLEKLVKSLWRGGGEVEIRKPNKVLRKWRKNIKRRNRNAATLASWVVQSPQRSDNLNLLSLKNDIRNHTAVGHLKQSMKISRKPTISNSVFVEMF